MALMADFQFLREPIFDRGQHSTRLRQATPLRATHAS